MNLVEHGGISGLFFQTKYSKIYFTLNNVRKYHLKQQPARSEPGLSLDMVDDAEIERELVGDTL